MTNQVRLLWKNHFSFILEQDSSLTLENIDITLEFEYQNANLFEFILIKNMAGNKVFCSVNFEIFNLNDKK